MRFPAVIVLCVSLLPGAPRAATLIEAQTGFSAERTLVVDGHTYQGKVWAMPGKERHEQALYGMQPVFLLRADQRARRDRAAGPQDRRGVRDPGGAASARCGGAENHPVGSETVNGVATTKYAIDKAIPEGHAEGTLWLSRDGIPMRLAGTFKNAKGKVSTVRWELSGVKTGPQPAALFEPPTGWRNCPRGDRPTARAKVKGDGK